MSPKCGFNKSGINLDLPLTSLAKLEPEVLATTNDESVWISYADISVLVSSIFVTKPS